MANLTIALSKGRIYKDTLPLLAEAGIVPLEDPETSRKLIIETSRPGVRVVVIRAADVPTFVEHGAADLGVSGKDVLMENPSNGLYEPLDLEIARCRLMVAAPASATAPSGRLRVATKYIETARRWYAARGEQVELIKLYGSMELAPLVDLADCIVDLVETGSTLKANGLEPRETIAHISSRLVVNKASMKMKHAEIQPLLEALERAVIARRAEKAA